MIMIVAAKAIPPTAHPETLGSLSYCDTASSFRSLNFRHYGTSPVG